MSSARSVLVFPAPAPPFPGAVAVAERIEAGVFRATFGEQAAALRSYYAAHLPQTVFVLVHDGGWAGMLRLGVPGRDGSLSLADALRPPFAVRAGEVPGPLLDVLTAAVRRRFRSRGVFEDLLGAAARVAHEHGCVRVGAMTDRRVLAYVRYRGLPVAVHSGLHPYYGSPATGFVSADPAALASWAAGRRAARGPGRPRPDQESR
jgi:GNAT superfamily N-acetyltransferase